MLSIIFVVKTKITIWAESTKWIQPFLFFFSKVLPDSDNLFCKMMLRNLLTYTDIRWRRRLMRHYKNKRLTHQGVNG